MNTSLSLTASSTAGIPLPLPSKTSSASPIAPIDHAMDQLFKNIQASLREGRGILLDIKSLFVLARTCRKYSNYLTPLWKSIFQETLNHQRSEGADNNSLCDYATDLIPSVARRMVGQICKNNIFIDLNDLQLIRKIIKHDCPDLLQFLLSFNVHFNPQNQEETALFFASSSSIPSIRCMQVLIKEEVQLETDAGDINSLLRLAAVNGDLAGVRAQLAAGADVNSISPSYYTAVWLAAMAGHLDVMNVLLDILADICLCNRSGVSPLSIAAMMGYDAIVCRLLADHADLNYLEATDEEGFTPLLNAALTGQANVVQTLLTAKAEIDIPAYLGQTPLSVAQNAGHLDVVAILETAKAKLELAAAISNSALNDANEDASVTHDEDAAVHPSKAN